MNQREINKDEIVLQKGVVAIVDALGFKGIWRRHSPTKIVQAMREARNAVKADLWIPRLVKSHNAVRTALDVRFFSDTVVVTETEGCNGSAAELQEAIVRVVRWVRSISTAAAERDPPLAYRGCIAVGQLHSGGDFWIGPAIDEAAQWAEEAQAAVTWLLPSAAAAFDEPGRRLYGDELIDWPVPLHGGGSLRSLVVNPFDDPRDTAGGSDRYTIQVRREHLLRPFDGSTGIDVVLKRQNTEQLLACGEEMIRAYMKKVLVEPDGEP